MQAMSRGDVLSAPLRRAPCLLHPAGRSGASAGPRLGACFLVKVPCRMLMTRKIAADIPLRPVALEAGTVVSA